MNLLLIRLRLFILLSFTRFKGKIINIWKRLPFNQKNLEEPEIDNHEKSVIEQEEYNLIFLNKTVSSPFFMPRPILSNILKALPEGYVFPSSEINSLIVDELEKHRSEMIDIEIMEQIQKQLPQNYSLHNPFVFQYNIDNSFSDNLNHKIDHEVQRQISNNLPSHSN